MTTPQTQVQRPAIPAEGEADGKNPNDGNDLLNRAQETKNEQTALLEATPLEAQYETALAAEVEAKHDQVERLENRMEELIDRQASRLQQTQASQPGRLAFPGALARWQQQLHEQQNTMQRLQGRLETVREIKEEMGIYGPRIEELASRKLRAQAPELVEEWNEMQAAQRLHQAHFRQQEKEKRLAQKNEPQEQLGRGLYLGLTRSKG